MKSVALNASVRAGTRRTANKRLRTNGRIPAVIYGRQAPPQNLEVDAKELNDLIHHGASENVLVDLSVKDDPRAKRLALVQDVQHHPLSGRVLHVDLHEVSETEKVTISVPLETTGEAIGVKTGGGVLEHVMFKLKVRALPKDLPEQIVVDVTALEMGRSIHLGDIKAPERVEILGRKEAVVIACAAPRAEEEAAPAEAAPAAAGEVEMIKEKKEEGAEAAPAKGAAPKAGEKAAAPAAGEKKAEKPAEKKK
jgi:large subunit ribosomal protein L25